MTNPIFPIEIPSPHASPSCRSLAVTRPGHAVARADASQDARDAALLQERNEVSSVTDLPLLVDDFGDYKWDSYGV